MKDIRPTICHRCDFGSGQRGMDRCSTCDGTGSVFRVAGKYFPNTENGYNAAVAQRSEDAPNHPVQEDT